MKCTDLNHHPEDSFRPSIKKMAVLGNCLVECGAAIHDNNVPHILLVDESCLQCIIYESGSAAIAQNTFTFTDFLVLKLKPAIIGCNNSKQS